MTYSKGIVTSMAVMIYDIRKLWCTKNSASALFHSEIIMTILIEITVGLMNVMEMTIIKLIIRDMIMILSMKVHTYRL